MIGAPVTLLFTDLVDSTGLLRRVGDERAQRILHAHRQLLREALASHGGREVKWLGDGVLTTFASVADGVRCAVTMAQRARRPVAGERLGLRLGLHVGEVLPDEADYVGTPVVLARRLCDRATAGQILCSGVVVELLRGRQGFTFAEVGPLELKGFPEPVVGNEVVYRPETGAALLRHTPFTGRIVELRRLTRRLEEARAGQGSVVLLAGEPGIGKTRIIEEIAATARAQGALVLSGRCYEGEAARSFGPFVEALADYARTAPAEVLRADLGLYAPSLLRLVPAIRERLPDVSEPVPLEPSEERVRLLDAVTQSLLALATRVPTVLVLDDLHWADPGTVTLLRHVARFAPRARLLVLGAYRDVEVAAHHPLTEVLGTLPPETSYEQLKLVGLDAAAVKELVETVAEREMPAAWLEALTRETSGNPFFLREVLLHLGEEGAWAREDGSAPPTLEALGLPDTVRQVIMRRLARLSDATGQFLRVAAAFTGGIDFEVARRVAGLEERDALDALDAALGAQLLAATGAGATAYDFTHALVRHTLYEGLSPARQARLHRAIAEMMEAVYDDRAGEHAAAVAQQYHCSKDLAGAERGVTYAVTAADRAEAMYTHDDVVRLLRIAVELTPQTAARPARLLGRLALALTWVLNFEEALQAAQEAGELIAATEGAAAAADYLGEATINLAEAGSLQSAWRVARQGMAYIGTRRDVTWLRLVSYDVMRREQEDADYPGLPLDCPERREMSVLACSLSPVDLKGIMLLFPRASQREEPLRPQVDFMSDFRGSLAALEELATACEREGRTNAAAVYFAGVARGRLARGEIRAADQARARAVAFSDRLLLSPRAKLGFAIYRFERCTVVNEGWAELPLASAANPKQPNAEQMYAFAGIQAGAAVIAARLGQADAALQLLAAIRPALDRGPAWVQIYPAIACNAALALWCAERVAHADCVERNLREKVIAPDSRYPMVDGRLALAHVCALQRRYDEAVEWFAQARGVLDEQGARPLRAIVDYDEALMYVRRGESRDVTRALPLLEVAMRQFHAVGMPGWIRAAQDLLEKCGRRTAEGGVEELPSPIPDPQAAMQTVSRREDPLDDPSSSALPSATAAAIPPTRAAATDGPNVFRREGESDPGDPGSDDAAVFRREGDVWTVTWAGRTVRLRDARGFAYLAVLLRHPDRELHATDIVRLAGGGDVGDGARPRPDRELATSPDLGHAGTILDARAHTAYRARLAELREELAEAEGRNDLGRVERCREEIAALVQQLSGAKRGRTAAAHGERARVAVTKGLKGALERIAASHPELGRHLTATVRRGYFCVYRPDPARPVHWDT